MKLKSEHYAVLFWFRYFGFLDFYITFKC